MRFRHRSRAMKDKATSANANRRLAKAAAAMREEVVDNEEDVVPYQHIGGGEVGKTIRLRRMNPSSSLAMRLSRRLRFRFLLSPAISGRGRGHILAAFCINSRTSQLMSE